MAGTVISLALAVGPLAAVAVLVHDVLLRPLPFDEPERLVSVWGRDPGADMDRLMLSAQTFVDLREENRTFESLAAYKVDRYTITGSGDATRVHGAAVTAELFGDVLRAPPILGRGFRREDELPGSEPVAILGHGFWDTRFDRDPAILGREIVLDEEPHVVIGVLPESFEFQNPEPDLLVDLQIWTPLEVQRYLPLGRGLRFLRVIGRLGEGLEPARAEADLASILAVHDPEAGDSARGHRIQVVSLHEQLVRHVERSLWVLLAAVILLLLVAWGDALNLLLARLVERRKELGVRTAMGARPGHLLRDLIAENATVALLGGAVGGVLGLWLVNLLVAASPRDIPRLDQAELGIEVLGVAVVVSVATTLVFSLITAPAVSRHRAIDALSEAGRVSRTSGRRLRYGFVAVELALSVVLLVCGGLLIRSLSSLQRVELAFSPEDVLTAKIELPWSRYGGEGKMAGFYRMLGERVGRVPGVTSVGFAKDLPLSGEETEVTLSSRHLPGPSGPEESGIKVPCRIVTPGYLETMRIPLVRGAGVSVTPAGAPARFVINRSLARRLSGGSEILGREIVVHWFGQELAGEVAGVVADVRHRSPRLDPNPAVYVPLDRLPYPNLTLVVRGRREPTSLVADIRRAVMELDPQLPLVDVEPLEQRVARALATERFLSLLIGGFGIVALFLSLIGLYGILAYSVSKEARQIGMRMALGAPRTSVASLILKRMSRVVAWGTVFGLAGGFAFSDLLSSVLYGVESVDFATALAVAAGVGTFALIASLVPAWRAMSIDPANALKDL